MQFDGCRGVLLHATAASPPLCQLVGQREATTILQQHRGYRAAAA